jgi:hypothetical protein
VRRALLCHDAVIAYTSRAAGVMRVHSTTQPFATGPRYEHSYLRQT